MILNVTSLLSFTISQKTINAFPFQKKTLIKISNVRFLELTFGILLKSI